MIMIFSLSHNLSLKTKANERWNESRGTGRDRENVEVNEKKGEFRWEQMGNAFYYVRRLNFR